MKKFGLVQAWLNILVDSKISVYIRFFFFGAVLVLDYWAKPIFAEYNPSHRYNNLTYLFLIPLIHYVFFFCLYRDRSLTVDNVEVMSVPGLFPLLIEQMST